MMNRRQQEQLKWVAVGVFIGAFIPDSWNPTILLRRLRGEA